MYQTPLTWSQRGQLWLRLGIRLVLVILAVFGAKLLLRPGLTLFAPFVAALIAAAVLDPVVRWVQKKLGWSRRLLSLLILLLLLSLLGGGVSLMIYAAGTELISLAQNWESLFSRVLDILPRIERLFAGLETLLPAPIPQVVGQLGQELWLWVQNSAASWLTMAAEFATSKAVRLPSLLLSVVFFVMATYFLASDYPYLRTRAVQNMDEGLRTFLGQVRSTALAAFGGYLKAQALLSVGVFFILLLGFTLTRQSYALLLALGLAVLDFIPLLGAGTVMLPWGAIALLTGEVSAGVRMLVIWGCIVVYRRVAEPRVVGDQTGLSPILSLASIYVGMKLGGVGGMILGPILTLMVLNLAGIGVFRPIRRDLSAAVDDISALLSQRPDQEET